MPPPPPPLPADAAVPASAFEQVGGLLTQVNAMGRARQSQMHAQRLKFLLSHDVPRSHQ